MAHPWLTTTLQGKTEMFNLVLAFILALIAFQAAPKSRPVDASTGQNQSNGPTGDATFNDARPPNAHQSPGYEFSLNDEAGKLAYQLSSKRGMVSEARVYWFNHELSTSGVLLRRYAKNDLTHANMLGQVLAGKILEMDGVESVLIMPNSLTVTIGRAFTWYRVDAAIVRLIQKTVWKRIVYAMLADQESDPTTYVVPTQNRRVQAFAVNRELIAKAEAEYRLPMSPRRIKELEKGSTADRIVAALAKIETPNSMNDVTVRPYSVEITMLGGHYWSTSLSNEVVAAIHGQLKK